MRTGTNTWTLREIGTRGEVTGELKIAVGEICVEMSYGPPPHDCRVTQWLSILGVRETSLVREITIIVLRASFTTETGHPYILERPLGTYAPSIDKSALANIPTSIAWT